MHACMHACLYVCMYVCMYVCIYIYRERERDREREREGEREREREKAWYSFKSLSSPACRHTHTQRNILFLVFGGEAILRKSDPDIAMEALKQWERQGLLRVAKGLGVEGLGFESRSGFRNFVQAASTFSSGS